MFIRVALLLLLAFSVDAFEVEDRHKNLEIRNVEHLKTHQILKDIGKRFLPLKQKKKKVPDLEKFTPDIEAPSWSFFGGGEFRKWDLVPEEEVTQNRRDVASMMINSLAMATSRENEGYGIAMNNLGMVIDPDFFAEICEDGKQLNPYQYLKYVRQSSSLYRPNAESIGFELLESNRRSIHAKANFVTLDNNGLEVQFDYEFKMKLTFSSQYNFSLIYLKQGGSCVNEGNANMDLTGVKDIVAEELEGLKTAPTMKLFFELFTPSIYKNVAENPEHIPKHWLSGLEDSVQIQVCQEGVDDAVQYTVDDFLVWYEKFGMLWHRPTMSSKEHIVQILELTEESISARVTLTLQIGLDKDAPEEDWNFKFSGKKKDGFWSLDTISVMCIASINYQEQSLKNVQELIAETFVRELGYLNDTQWSFTPELIKKFTKHRSQVEVTECKKGEVTSVQQSDLFIKDKNNQHGIKFTKYSLVKEDVPSPAPETHLFRFDTAGIAADSSSQEEQEYQWGFDLKWDQKDQFYYIYRMGIGCAKPWTTGKLFESISFDPKRR